MRTSDEMLADLEQVYRAQFRSFMRTALAYLGDVDAARDAVQEGIATAIRTRRTYRGEGSLEAWTWRVVLNAIRSHYRDQAHEFVFAGEPQSEQTRESSNGRVPVDAVRWAIRRLPERQRLVLFLRFYADMDYRTIADLLDLSEGTVGASLNAARSTLRTLLEEVPT